MKLLQTLLATLLVLGAVSSLQAAEPSSAQDDAQKDAAVIAAQAPSYPLDTCLVSGEKMDKPVDVVANGQLLRTCCNTCAKKVKANPTDFIAKVKKAVVADQKDSYPLKTCAVMGEELAEEDIIEHVHGTRLVRLCCKGCIRGFQKDPAKTMAKIDAALIEQQKKTYPMDTCVVSKQKLGSMGDPIDVLYGTQLVRLCCKGCTKAYQKDPAGTVAKIRAAAKKAGTAEKKKG